MPRAAALLVVASVLLAGCGSLGGTATETRTTTGADDGCTEGLYPINIVGADDGSPSSVFVDYAVPPENDVVVVLFVDGSPVAVQPESTDEYAVAADYIDFELDSTYNGTHRVRVGIYDDVDEDWEFDPGTDKRCLVDDPNTASTERVLNFSNATERVDLP